MSISVLKKNILLKSYFYLKDDKDYVGGLCIKMLYEIKEKLPPKYTQKRIQCFLA